MSDPAYLNSHGVPLIGEAPQKHHQDAERNDSLMQDDTNPTHIEESKVQPPNQNNNIHGQYNAYINDDQRMSNISNGNYGTNQSEEGKGEDDSSNRDDENRATVGVVNANIYQAAILNKILPKGFRIELEENALRTLQTRQQAALAAANQLKKSA